MVQTVHGRVCHTGRETSVVSDGFVRAPCATSSIMEPLATFFLRKKALCYRLPCNHSQENQNNPFSDCNNLQGCYSYLLHNTFNRVHYPIIITLNFYKEKSLSYSSCIILPFQVQSPEAYLSQVLVGPLQKLNKKRTKDSVIDYIHIHVFDD